MHIQTFIHCLKTVTYKKREESNKKTAHKPTQPNTLLERERHTHTHTHPFNGPLSGTTRVSRYQKGKTNLDFTEARDSEWQWHQLGHVQLCTSLQTDNHTSTSPLSFLQAGCPFCRPTNSVKALKAHTIRDSTVQKEKKYLTVCQCSATEIIHNRLMHSANTPLYQCTVSS